MFNIKFYDIFSQAESADEVQMDWFTYTNGKLILCDVALDITSKAISISTGC